MIFNLSYKVYKLRCIDEGFGRGNLGQAGFQGFLQTHRCNAICKLYDESLKMNVIK